MLNIVLSTTRNFFFNVAKTALQVCDPVCVSHSPSFFEEGKGGDGSNKVNI